MATEDRAPRYQGVGGSDPGSRHNSGMVWILVWSLALGLTLIALLAWMLSLLIAWR
ncbi:MAG: hypothetical protein M3Q71_17325 [Chloroflexota bacterium]|nr:hypothetical protein [Chloroflexota bacterium]